LHHKTVHTKNILIIYNEPTILTTDSIDPNGLTLLLGLEGGMNLSFLLRNNAVEYLVSSNWKNDFPESEYNASWEWISNEINGNVYAILEDIEKSIISRKDIDQGIKIISNADVSSIIDKNDVIFVY
tara:strand:+ start:478 stop:858 length:381 start_codon:yes stop_codon:yes gene_type:complete